MWVWPRHNYDQEVLSLLVYLHDYTLLMHAFPLFPSLTQVRREGFRHFMRGGLPHALALASCLASVLIISLAAPHAWNLYIEYHAQNNNNGSSSSSSSSSGDGNIEEIMAPLARRVVAKLALARCLDMVRLLARVPLSSRIFDTIGK